MPAVPAHRAAGASIAGFALAGLERGRQANVMDVVIATQDLNIDI